MTFVVFTALFCSGCLHTYHDYGKPGEWQDNAGYSIGSVMRLFHGPGNPVDGKIVDSSAVYWGMSWHVYIPEGPLAKTAFIKYDSLRIWPASNGDTLACDSAVRVPRYRHEMGWQCGEISFARLHSPEIHVHMVLRFLDADNHLLGRREALLTHDLRKTVVHSDY